VVVEKPVEKVDKCRLKIILPGRKGVHLETVPGKKSG